MNSNIANDIKNSATFENLGIALRNYAVKSFHPRSLFMDAIGAIWGAYYLWQHDIASAIGAVFFARVVAFLFIMDVDAARFSETAIGKLGVLHLNPKNLAIQLSGIVVLIAGVWQHNLELGLVGVSVVLIGHMFGWSNIDPRFGSEE